MYFDTHNSVSSDNEDISVRITLGQDWHFLEIQFSIGNAIQNLQLSPDCVTKFCSPDVKIVFRTVILFDKQNDLLNGNNAKSIYLHVCLHK